MPFDFHRLEIPDVVRIEARAFPDARGFFMETYKRSSFEAAGLDATFVQDNFSRSRRGVFRGLHFQNPPKAQGKLVGVIRGEILDYAVDVRVNSPTYGRWVSEVLSDADGSLLYVPAGFAHGFLALSEEADVVYKVTEEYAPEYDSGVIFSDPDIGLNLPIDDPILSDKDFRLPRLADADNRFLYEGARA